MSQDDKNDFLQLIVVKPKKGQGFEIFKQSGLWTFYPVWVQVTPYFFKAIDLCCQPDNMVKGLESPVFVFQRLLQAINKNLRQDLIAPSLKPS